MLFKRCGKKDFEGKRPEGARSKMLTMMMVMCETERVVLVHPLYMRSKVQNLQTKLQLGQVQFQRNLLWFYD